MELSLYYGVLAYEQVIVTHDNSRRQYVTVDPHISIAQLRVVFCSKEHPSFFSTPENEFIYATLHTKYLITYISVTIINYLIKRIFCKSVSNYLSPF
jgi:hypothetical protein